MQRNFTLVGRHTNVYACVGLLLCVFTFVSYGHTAGYHVF